MNIPEFLSLQTQVLWAAFAVSVVFGAVVQKSHFCTMGAISDIVNMGDWGRMRMWVLAVGVAVLGFQSMAWQGIIDPSKTIYTPARVVWLSALLGGLLFGVGMVLASGCGSKTLVRLGAGSLKALVVFLVMGVSAFATLRGLLAVWRVNTVDTVAFDMAGGSSLPVALAGAWGVPSAAPVLGMALGAVVLALGLGSKPYRRWAEVAAGGAIGTTVVAMWWVTGHLGFVAEHPETLGSVFVRTNSGLMESLTFTAPMAYALDWFIQFSDASKVLSVAVVSVVGVVLGSWACALATRTFRWEGFRDTQDTALHLLGAVLMGAGGVTAMGCTIGQGLSGLSALGLTSLVAVLAIVLGALLGLRSQTWLIMRG